MAGLVYIKATSLQVSVVTFHVFRPSPTMLQHVWNADRSRI